MLVGVVVVCPVRVRRLHGFEIKGDEERCVRDIGEVYERRIGCGWGKGKSHFIGMKIRRCFNVV